MRKAAPGQGPGLVTCSTTSVTPSMQRLLIFCMNAAYFQGARLLLSTSNSIAMIFRSLKGVLTLGVPHFNLQPRSCSEEIKGQQVLHGLGSNATHVTSTGSESVKRSHRGGVDRAHLEHSFIHSSMQNQLAEEPSLSFKYTALGLMSLSLVRFYPAKAVQHSLMMKQDAWRSAFSVSTSGGASRYLLKLQPDSWR